MSIIKRISGFFKSKPRVEKSTQNPPKLKKVDLAALAENPNITTFDLNEGAKHIARINKEWAETVTGVGDALKKAIETRPDFQNKRDQQAFMSLYDETKEELGPVLSALFLEVQKRVQKTKMKDMPGTFFSATCSEILMYILWDFELTETRKDRDKVLKLSGVEIPQEIGRTLAVQMHVRQVMNHLCELMMNVSNHMAAVEIKKGMGKDK